MRASIKLFSLLPGVLKGAWGLLLVGMVSLAAGYFTRTPWQSYVGLGCLILGYSIAILDLLNRKRNRDKAAGFYAGAYLAPIATLVLLLLVALIGAIVLAVQSAIHGFSATHAMRMLHFLGIAFAFATVSGIPALALKAMRDEDNGQGPEARSDSAENSELD